MEINNKNSNRFDNIYSKITIFKYFDNLNLLWSQKIRREEEK